MKSINKVKLFLTFTFLISFTLAGLYRLSGLDYSDGNKFIILGIMYMFIPAISVILVDKVIHKEKLKTNLFISFKFNKWFIVAWLIMPVISFATLGISLLFPDVFYSPEMSGMIKRFEAILSPEQIEQMKESLENLPFNPILIALFQGLIAGITINAVAAFGEELGWRGFLLREFKEMSFFKASIIIGFIWGIWHAPIILMGHNYPQHPEIGVVMMTIFCILLTPVFIYITIKSKSVIAAAILHGTLNGTAGLSMMKIDGGNDLITGITGLAGFICLIIVLLLFFIYDNKVSKEKIMLKRIEESLYTSLLLKYHYSHKAADCLS